MAFLPITGQRCRIEFAKESKVKNNFTSDVCMGVLWYIFEHRQYFVDDVVSLKIGNYILKFTVGDASDFGFYIVEVLRVVRQEHFELFLTHRCCQFLNFRDKFVSDSPWKLVWNYVEVALQSSRTFLLRKRDNRVNQIYFIRLFLIFRKQLYYLQNWSFSCTQPPHQIFWVLSRILSFDDGTVLD